MAVAARKMDFFFIVKKKKKKNVEPQYFSKMMSMYGSQAKDSEHYFLFCK